jgi:hypothetical protein
MKGPDSQELYVDVTAPKGAGVTCEPECGSWTAGESPFPEGPVRAPIPLEPKRGEQTYKITVQDGLFKKSTKSFTYDYQPNVFVRTGQEGPMPVRCYLSSCEGTLGVDVGEIKLELTSKEATRAALGKASAPFADGKATVKTNAAVLAGDLDLAKLSSASTFDVKLDVEVAFADLTVKKPVEIRLATNGVVAALREGKDRPLELVADKPAPAKAAGLLLVDDGSPKAYGEVKKLQDVDLIAVSETKKRKVNCGTYVGGGKSMNVTIDAIDADLEVFDRRTGKSVAKKSFSAGSSCGDTLEARNDPSKELVLLVEEKLIDAWLEGQVKTAVAPK